MAGATPAAERLRRSRPTTQRKRSKTSWRQALRQDGRLGRHYWKEERQTPSKITMKKQNCGTSCTAASLRLQLARRMERFDPFLVAAFVAVVSAVAWWRQSVALANRDAIVRANPPKQLRTAPLLRSGGKVVKATETLRVLARQMSEGRQLGVQLSCWFRGEEAISIISGAHRRAVPRSDGEEWLPIAADTLLHGYSVTKGIVAALLLALVDDGVLSYDDRVASIWPEMHDERIGALTVAEIVSHRGGLYISPRFALEVRDLGYRFVPFCAHPNPSHHLTLLPLTYSWSRDLQYSSRSASGAAAASPACAGAAGALI